MAQPKIEVIQATTAMKQAVRRVDSDIPPAMEKLKQVARSSVDEAEALARSARHSSGMLVAVRPPPKPTQKVTVPTVPTDPRMEPGTVRAEDDQIPVDSITQKYNALRNFK